MNFIQPRLGNDEVSYDNFFKMHMNNIKPEVKTEPFSSFVPLMKMIEHDTEEDDTQRNFGVQYNNTLPDYYVKPEMSSPFPHGIASDSFFYGSGVKEEFPNFMTDHINTGHLESTDAGINEIVEHTYEEIKELINRTDVRCSDNVVDSTTNGYEQPQDRKQERTRLTESQRRALILEFNACNYPDLETMKDLAMSLSLSVKAVQTWFCNRRYRSAQQKERRQNKLEGKQERLKLTESQRNILLSTFNECSHPEMEKISELAKMLSLSVRTVQTWFCKQRYRSSVQQKEKPQNTIDTQQSRLKLTETQKMILVLEFNKSNLPDLETVNRLSRNLNLSPKSIQTWFANRRYRNTPQKESSNMLNEYSVPHTGVDDKNGFSGMMNLQNSLSNMSPTASATHIPTYNSSSFSHSLLHNSSPCKSLANAVMNQNESVRCKTVLSYDDDDEDDKKDGGLVIDTHVGMRKRKVKEEEHPEFSDEDDEFLRIQEKQMERLDESFKPNVPLGYLVPKFNRPTRECKKKPLVESPADSVPTSTCSSTTPTKTVLTPVSKVDKKKPYNVKKFPVIIPPKEPKQVQKPKKGMATVKQRLGRILGIHKMKF